MWYKNIKAQNILILLLSLTGLSCTFYLVNLKTQISAEDRYEIEQTVFSFLIGYIKDHPDEDPDYFFIGVSESDPAPEMLTSFNSHVPAVAPISSAKMTFGFTSPVVHKSYPSKKGIIIDLKEMDKQPDGKVRVLTYLYQSRGSTSTYEHILSKNDGSYHVISIKQREN